MSFYNSFARSILVPVHDAVKGERTMKNLRALEASQWWPSAQLETLQSERLQSLLQHTYTHVPHYRRLMDERDIRPTDITSAAALALLPVLTKATIRENLRDLVAEGFPRRELRQDRTGGSTGTPMTFYGTRDERVNYGYARHFRALGWAGVRFADRMVVIHEMSGTVSPSQRVLRRLDHMLHRVTPFDTGAAAEAYLPDVVSTLRRTRPSVLRAYPSVLYLIATFLKSSEQSITSIRTIVAGGEQLFDYQRQAIREVFGVEPFSKYSSMENWDIACECEAHAGMHIQAEDLVVEVVDDRGNPALPGQQGRILVTNLHNYGMPFIRYDTDDYGRLIPSTCSCGRTLPMLDITVGRCRDYIETASRGRISGTGIGIRNMATMGVTQFQLVQEIAGQVTARIVAPGLPRADSQDAVRRAVVEILQKRFGDDTGIQVEFVGRIDPTPSGKHMAVVSRLA
ncbi:MAG: phenylacetate--CoA ligase family protein, partial [Dehalococcoidia bacterium]